ncbi:MULTISPECIES: phage tail protein [Lysobacter]|uniref:phage tail protein n=1 Tax=Lysobacter TaxID=68 RepID=UPI0004D019F1|nr:MULTISPECIES: tail fiber protein [Lysobacter]
MTEPFIGQIQIFGFNFAPRGWAFCNGATLAIQQNTALFSLLGTQYGGNGTTTFQLPNFVNRTGCNQGQGPGLTPHQIGENFGSNSVTLTTQEMPAHTHAAQIYGQNDASKRQSAPANGNALGTPLAAAFTAAGSTDSPFPPTMIGPTGGGQPHENRQPYLAMNFCIALQGIFPSFP